MAILVKFGNFEFEDSDGVFSDPVLGIMNRVWEMKRLIRADGEVAHDRGRTGADHTVTVKFLDVPYAGVSDVRDRVEGLVATPQEDDLTIIDQGTFPNCVCTGVTPSPATRGVIIGAVSGVFNPTKTYNMEFALSFRQLRP